MRKIRFIPQIMQSECGLCCIAMIADYHRHYITLDDLREYQQPGREGVSARNICQILKWIQFDYKVYKCDLSGLKRLPTPMIVYWQKSHYMIVEKISKHRVFAVDPSLGRVIFNYEEFIAGFSNVAIIAFPAAGIVRQKKAPSVWTSFLPMILADKWIVFIMLLFSILTYFISIIIPKYVQSLIDMHGGITIKFVLLGAALLLAYALSSLINSFIGVILKTKVYKRFYEKVIQKITQAEYKYFENRLSGNTLHSINSIESVNEFYVGNVIATFVSLGACIILCAFFATVSLSSFLLLIATVLIFFVIFSITNKKMTYANQAEISSRSTLSGVQTELISTMETIKVAAAEKSVFGRWKNVFDTTVEKRKKSETARMTLSSITSLMSMILPILVLFFSLYEADQGKISTGEAILLYSISSIFAEHFTVVLSSLCFAEVTKNHLDRLQDIILQKPEQSGDFVIQNISCIELKNISFRYNKNAPEVLKEVNMRFEKNRKIAIVGESGSGKSSIARLLIKLYLPTDGQLLYDGISHEKIENSSLRKKISLIPQTGTIFTRSIWENLVMLSESYNEDEVISICKDLHIHDAIMQMPMKYETILSENGSNISGGQRQKILIARALLSKAEYLVLDEATCAMDSVGEQAIYDTLKKRDCTQIIITHRLSTIADADYIYVIKDHRICEEGVHEKLIQNKGEYYHLFIKAEKLTAEV